MPARRPMVISVALFAAAAAAAAGFVIAFPAVEGLGTKVKLPVFHGAMTWVNLALFSIMGILGIAYVFTRREGLYRWEESARWIGVSMWTAGSVLGFLAALQTWDFSGSKSSTRMEIVTADPRLMAQFWIVLAGFAIIAFALLIEDRLWLATFDVGFVAVTWLLLLRAILGPGRALHPDSPVLNSEEFAIKALFFGMVLSVAVGAFALTSIVKGLREARVRRHEAALAEAV